MPDDLYERLAHHLDRLPGGFPPTEDGLELRILKRLFTPEQAELALQLTLIPERATLIAQRAGLPLETAQQRLDEMASQGLISDNRREGKPPRYAAAQFVIGIWEYQVKRLTPELAKDVGEYLQIAYQPEIWKKIPQLRVIPVGESIPAQAEVMPYEQAENLLRRYDTFAVAPCICREEKALLNEGCGKPLETCLLMGGAAKSYLRHLRARQITIEEALQILETADRSGLVLQPGNTVEAANICCCCGDCCGVLRNARRHPQPARLFASAFYAACDADLCIGCEDCLSRCQMEAIRVNGTAQVNLERCIGCGLCVSSCPSAAMKLVRKSPDEIPEVPQNNLELYTRIARERGVLSMGDIGRMGVRSAVDRMRYR